MEEEEQEEEEEEDKTEMYQPFSREPFSDGAAAEPRPCPPATHHIGSYQCNGPLCEIAACIDAHNADNDMIIMLMLIGMI